MPTEKKREQVADLAELMRQCTIAISTDFRGLRVTEMTSLRRHPRGAVADIPGGEEPAGRPSGQRGRP